MGGIYSRGDFGCNMGTNQVVLLQDNSISFKHFFLQIKRCCLEIRSGRVILFVGMMFVQVCEGSREVLVLCCSLGGEECFISVSGVRG